ncbi:MAG: HDIG domain-containing metalloprotein [Aminipila sp.]
MTSEKKLFELITNHLLQDHEPSVYLNQISNEQAFEAYPFNMLLDLMDTEQDPKHHPEGNVWNHTMLVVDEAAKQKSQSINEKVFMWAALLHDIGKPAATEKRRNRITAYDHDKIGEKLCKKFLLSVDCPLTFTEQVSSLVRFHMHPLFIIKNLPFSDLKGLRSRTNPQEVALLSLCDRMGRTNPSFEKEQENVNLFLSKFSKVEH